MSKKFILYREVLNAMQEADEIEGLEGQDYIDFMDMIIAEAKNRKQTCIEYMYVNDRL